MPEQITLKQALDNYPVACDHALVEAGWILIRYDDGRMKARLHPILGVLCIEFLGWAVATELTRIWRDDHSDSEVAFPIRDIAPDPLRWALTALEAELKTFT